MNTPVAFLIFNRPQKTARVFEAIRQAKPAMLLVIADGPRPDQPGEAEKCAATRAVISQVDWNCTVLKNYADENLGCQQRIVSGLDWVFDQVEAAIILEDDCLPHPTFFPFCEALLQCYADDERVMTISGENFQPRQQTTPYSYYFSQFMHCWGWASWRRAWQHFDLGMQHWPILRDSAWLNSLFPKPHMARYWRGIFDQVYDNGIDTWDYTWQYSIWTQHGLNILPNRNLVSNIGFDAAGTHTVDPQSLWANLPVQAMPFPLKHPPHLVRNTEADVHTQKTIYQASNLAQKIWRKISA